MSEVEFILVGFSIVVSFAFAKLIEGLYRCVLQFRANWIRTAWIVNRLIGAITYFWAFRALLDLGSFTFVQFAATIVGPALIYAQALALCPLEQADDLDRVYDFESVRRTVLGLQIAVMLVNAFAGWFLDIPIPLVGFAIQAVTCGFGLLSANQRLQALVVSVNLLVVIAGIFLPLAMQL